MEVTKWQGKRPSGIVASSSIIMTSLQDIPAEIILNILSWLPVKSLLCCRCVCKIWRNIIDSPSFTYMHFTTRRVDSAEEPQLIHVFKELCRLRLSFLKDDGTQIPIVDIAHPNYFAEPLSYGLICFRRVLCGHGFLINPLTRDVLMLPPATAPDLDNYGVGFDCTTETYKVVRVFSRTSVFDLGHPDMAAQVYTLGTSSWREIPTVPPFVYHFSVSAYGDVHWVGCRDEVGYMIMSFDIIKEEFKLTPHPNLPTEDFDAFQLHNFRGHLAMVDYSSMTHVEVWVLKDYDKKEWAMEYRISAELLIGQQNLNIDYQSNVAGIGPWEHDLLFKCGRKSLSYCDPETDSVKVRSLSGNVSIFGYIGSLVSLKNFGNMVTIESGLRDYFHSSTRSKDWKVCSFSY